MASFEKPRRRWWSRRRTHAASQTSPNRADAPRPLGPTASNLMKLVPAELFADLGLDGFGFEPGRGNSLDIGPAHSEGRFPLDYAITGCTRTVHDPYRSLRVAVRWYPDPASGGPEAGLERARCRLGAAALEYGDRTLTVRNPLGPPHFGSHRRVVHCWGGGPWYVEVAKVGPTLPTVDLAAVALALVGAMERDVPDERLAEARHLVAPLLAAHGSVDAGAELVAPSGLPTLGLGLFLPILELDLSRRRSLTSELSRASAARDAVTWPRSLLDVSVATQRVGVHSSFASNRHVMIDSSMPHMKESIDAAELWWLLEDLERLRAAAPQPAPAGPVVYRHTTDGGAELFAGEVYLSLDYRPDAELVDAVQRLRVGEASVSFEHALQAGGHDHWSWAAVHEALEVTVVRVSPAGNTTERFRATCQVDDAVRGVARGALVGRATGGLSDDRADDPLDALVDSMGATIRDVGDATYDEHGLTLPSDRPAEIVIAWYLLSWSGGVPGGAAVRIDFGGQAAFFMLNRRDGGWFENPDLLKAWFGLDHDTTLIPVERLAFTAALISWEAEHELGELDRLVHRRFS